MLEASWAWPCCCRACGTLAHRPRRTRAAVRREPRLSPWVEDAATRFVLHAPRERVDADLDRADTYVIRNGMLGQGRRPQSNGCPFRREASPILNISDTSHRYTRFLDCAKQFQATPAQGFSIE
jgi:hypothetical protein